MIFVKNVYRLFCTILEIVKNLFLHCKKVGVFE